MRNTATLALLFLSVLNFFDLNGQCSCTDCPIQIPSMTTQTSVIDVSGATNPIIGSGGQGICGISINFLTDAIKENTIKIIAPDGSMVTLAVNSGANVNQGISFDILFVPCGDAAAPDPGFPSIFDTNAGWAAGASYSGIYYPNMGCLEDFTGSVNGQWTLEFTDHVFLDDATVFDWEIIFCDPDGISCIPFSCGADGGDLDEGSAPYELCEGDPALDFDINVDFGGTTPDPADYGYTFVISDMSGILDYDDLSDLTSYSVGTYTICGLSYLLTDFPSLPSPNSGATTGDIQDDIDNDVYCADLSDCFDVTIDEPLTVPQLVGPLDVCAGELINYDVTNVNEDYPYVISLTTGSTSFFVVSGTNISTEWIDGPGQICFEQQNACADIDICWDITVTTLDVNNEIFGLLDVCSGSTEYYSANPPVDPSLMVNYTAINGTVDFGDHNGVNIIWDYNVGVYGQVCLEISNDCGHMYTHCLDVILNDFAPPIEMQVPSEMCEDQIIGINVTDDEEYSDYIWSVNDGSILQGQGTPQIVVEPDVGIGVMEVCIEVITNCQNSLFECELIDIYDDPTPTINILGENCGLSTQLEAQLSSNGTVKWTVIDGPGPIIISDDGSVNPVITASVPGQYTLELVESIGDCMGLTTFEIGLYPPLVLEDISYECNGNLGYAVEILLSGGAQPYVVNGEVINGASFVSDNIHKDSLYRFIIEDAIDCELVLIDEPECDCNSEAGTIADELIKVCVSDTIQVFTNQDEVVAVGDTSSFVLHSGQGISIEAPIQINSNGVFTFENGMVAGQVYYASHFVVNNEGSTIDLNGGCLDVSLGQPVVFYPYPSFENISDTLVCGNTFVFDEIVGNGSNLILNKKDITSPVVISNTGLDTFNIEAQEFIVTTFVLEADNEGCIESTEFDVQFSPGPSVKSENFLCDDGNEFYDLELILDGNGPFIVSDTLSIIDTLILNEIMSGDTVTISYIDENGCENVDEFTHDCACSTIAGTMMPDTLVSCDLSETLISIYLNDGVYGDLDTSVFLVFTDVNNPLSSTVDTISTSEISYSDKLHLDSVYFIAHVITAKESGSIDLQAPCTSSSNGQPFVYRSLPEPDLSIEINPCNLTAEYSNINSVFIENIHVDPLQSGGLPLVINDSIFADNPGLHQVTFDVNDGYCSNSIDTIIEMQVGPSVLNIDEVCNDNFYTVQFEINGGQGPYMVNDSIVLVNIYSSTEIESDSSYVFEVIDDNGCASELVIGQHSCACQNDVGSLMDGIYELCEGDAFHIPDNQDEVLNPGDTVSYLIYEGSMNQIDNVLSYQSNSVVEFQQEFLGKVIFVKKNIGQKGINDLVFQNSPCYDETPGIEVRWNALPTLTTDSDWEICEGEQLELAFVTSANYPLMFDLLDGNGEIVESITISENDAVIQLNGLVDGIYSVKGWMDEFCSSNEELEFFLTVSPLPNAGITLSDVGFCENDFEELNLFDYITNYQVGGEWKDPQESVVEGGQIYELLPGIQNYNYIVTNSCGLDTTALEITSWPSPQVDPVAEDVLCEGEENGLIYIPNSQLGEITGMFLNGEILSLSDSIKNLPAGEYQLEVVNYLNCSDVIDLVVEDGVSIDVDLGADLELEGIIPADLKAIIDFDETKVSSVIWNVNGTLDTVNSLSYVINPDFEGVVGVTIIDENGCETSDQILIRLKIDSDIILPNVFSPSGINNVFEVADYPQIKEVNSMTIYDRWGSLVHHVENDDEIIWNGTIDGKRAAAGVYVYMVKLTLINNQVIELHGDVTVLR